MVHLSKFSAVHYRGIGGVSLPHLSKANLITGANGVGKTALIEAMWLFTGRHNPGLLWNANVQRTFSPSVDPISRLTDGGVEFRGVEKGTCHAIKFVFEGIAGASPNVRITGTLQEESKRLPPVVGFIRTYLDGKLLTNEAEGMHLTPSGVVLYQSPRASVGRPGCVIESTRFQHETPAEYLQRYSSLVREGLKKELVKAINLVSERVEDLEMLTDDNGESYLSATITDGKPRPLHDLGGGAVRLVRLLLGFSAARDGILLSDELENGIHHAAQREIWDRARQWMDQWNVQFVATTHSGEFIDAAIDAFADNPKDLCIHKLFRNENAGQTEVATFTGHALAGARELDLEIR